MKFGEEELVFFFEDEIKEDAPELIAGLQKQNKRIILLSGDEENSVKKVAQKLTISEFYFAKTPLSKMQFLENL